LPGGFLPRDVTCPERVEFPPKSPPHIKAV
jgi:hypothetical protein